ncbi:MAG: nucleotidyl transferase AbiEii/AbiGii toxin family protein [bacterium]
MLRVATEKEKLFYEKRLYPLQDEVFKAIQTDKLYLSGGTALSRFYYNHRYSDDLDFFFDGTKHKIEEFGITVREIVNKLSTNFKIELTVDSELFIRAFVKNKETILKLEFIFENYKYVGNRKQVQGIIVDSKENLAVNKLTTIYDRRTAKDYVDLFFLLKEFDLTQIAKWAEEKIVPLDYEDVFTAFSAFKLEGTALLIKELPENEFNSFVKELIKTMVEYAKDR